MTGFDAFFAAYISMAEVLQVHKKEQSFPDEGSTSEVGS